jgi:flagellar export protein FliJ
MPYRFRLENLLRLRAGHERQEEQRLLQITQEILVCDREIEEQRVESQSLYERRRDALAKGINGSELSIYIVSFRGLRSRERALEKRKAELLLRWANQRDALQAARAKRKILEKLRDREATAYRTEQLRRDQATTDDLFATSHLRGKTE